MKLKHYLILVLLLIGAFGILIIVINTNKKHKSTIFATSDVISPINNFKSYEVIHLISAYNEYDYMKIETEYGKIVVIVEPDQFYHFDSVELKTSGDQYVVRIRESTNCKPAKDFSEYQPYEYSSQGLELTKKRCFSGAIAHYSNCIQVDSLNDDWYYMRGLNQMFRKNYETAIIDFFHGYSLLSSENFDHSTINRLLDSKRSANNKQLIKELEIAFSSSGDLKKLIHAKKAMELNDLDGYIKMIAFCYDKLKEHNGFK